MRSFFVIALAFSMFALGCSSTKSTPSNDAGTDGGSADGGPIVGGQVTDKGIAQDFDTKKGLAGVTASEASATTTTDANGNWSLKVPANTPITMTMTKDGYNLLQYPEVMLSGDDDRGIWALLSNGTETLISGSLPNFDATQGIVYIGFILKGTCTDGGGATVAMQSPSGAMVGYVSKNGFPSSTLTSTVNGQDPAAFFYNVQPGAKADMTVKHPTCKVTAFPVTDGTVTYTGNVVAPPSGGSAYVRYFLE